MENQKERLDIAEKHIGNHYAVESKRIGQYELTTLLDSPFVLFNDKVNSHKIYIPKRIINEMYHLIQSGCSISLYTIHYYINTMLYRLLTTIIAVGIKAIPKLPYLFNNLNYLLLLDGLPYSSCISNLYGV